MGAVRKRSESGFPGITISLVLGSLVFFYTPELIPWLVFARESLADGEIWRLITGHFVHFSWQHLFYNLMLFVVFALLLEVRNRGVFLLLIVVTTLAISFYTLLFIPEMTKYGGLSGVVSALVVFYSLSEIFKNTPTRSFWILILIIFIVKVSYELMTGGAVFVSDASSKFIVVPTAHIIGAVTAVVFMGYRKYKGKE